MDRGVDSFLGQLPTGSRADHALVALSAIAKEVASRLEVPVPRALTPVDGHVDDSILDALANLDDSDYTPDLLGVAWERMMSVDQRRSQGAHFTPRELAERVVERAIEGRRITDAPIKIWDPAAGGGAFLLAAAREVERRFGLERGAVVGLLYASDLDPLALRVCDASLELWCGGTARPHTAEGDALLDLPDDWPTDFDLVVGNPPFLGQLTSDTARAASETARLKQRYGALASGYVDQAGLFIELGLTHLARHGALGFVLPQSLLGSADAEPVRASAQRHARIASLWIDDDRSFDAAVEVVALVLVADDHVAGTTEVVLGAGDPIDVSTPSARSWASLLAAAQGVPVVRLGAGSENISDRATATAGFRQHYYGIADAVVESTDGEVGSGMGRGRLMTAGTIDPLADLWGSRPVKFAGTTWDAPVLLLERVEDTAVRQWFGDRLVPKLLMASQTAVLEVVVDTTGEMVPSVPVVTVEPHDPDMLWHLAAAITSPAVCAYLLTHAAGTGLSASAIRVRAGAIGAIPLPPPSTAWDTGAAEAERAQVAWAAGDRIEHGDALRKLAIAMGEAYGGDGRLVNWWVERLPKRRP